MCLVRSGKRLNRKAPNTMLGRVLGRAKNTKLYTEWKEVRDYCNQPEIIDKIEKITNIFVRLPKVTET